MFNLNILIVNKIVLTLFVTLFSLICESKPYKVSVAGENFIKQNETCQLVSYNCGGWTIGWGHHGKDVHPNQRISQWEADKLFREDMKLVNEAINRLIEALPYDHRFSQAFIDGLGDLIYNCGEGSVKRSTFYERLKRCRKNNKKDLEYTIAAIKTTAITMKGHIDRRYETHKKML